MLDQVRFKFKKNKYIIRASVVLSLGLAGIIIAVVLQQTQTFDFYSGAANPDSCKSKTKADCSGCFNNKYECKWDRNAKTCKVRYNKKKCGNPADDPNYTCKANGGTCIKGIASCSEVDRLDIKGSCYQGKCCGGDTNAGNTPYCSQLSDFCVKKDVNLQGSSLCLEWYGYSRCCPKGQAYTGSDLICYPICPSPCLPPPNDDQSLLTKCVNTEGSYTKDGSCYF